MRLAFTSDIHIDKNGDAALDALVARTREVAPDALLVSGDIATSPLVWLKTLLALRAAAPALLVVAGNHDVWTTRAAAEKGLDSWARLDKLLPALCAEADATLLDAGPRVIDNVGFAGSLGWYDLSTREHLLEVPMEAYRTGRWGGLRWMDHEFSHWKAEDGSYMLPEAVAERLRERLSGHLAALSPRKVVVATHMLAFSEQIHRKESPGWSFVNAFMGSLPLGAMIRGDPRVVLHIAGHTHLPSDVRLGHLRAVVSPLGYRGEWRGATEVEAVKRCLQVIDL